MKNKLEEMVKEIDATNTDRIVADAREAIELSDEFLNAWFEGDK